MLLTLKLISGVLTCAFAIACLAQDGSPSGKCSFTTLNIPAPAHSNASATDLNEVGAMVGNFTGSNGFSKGFLLSKGKFTSFSFPGAQQTVAKDLNNKGMIVGSFFGPSAPNRQRAFEVSASSFHEIHIPGFPNALSMATAVNDLGDVVGTYTPDANSIKSFGFFIHNGVFTTISFPGAKGGTELVGISNARTIVGIADMDEIHQVRKAFTWTNRNFKTFSGPGGVFVEPIKISNGGDIVGSFLDSNSHEHGFAIDHGRFSVISGPNTETAMVAANSKDQVLVFSFSATKPLKQYLGACSAVF